MSSSARDWFCSIFLSSWLMVRSSLRRMMCALLSKHVTPAKRGQLAHSWRWGL
uniref:Uncharacterized protein n=1 Tax=Arundo donax TaxID=35708 RepID=A0A0A9H1N8_ARUDO